MKKRLLFTVASLLSGFMFAQTDSSTVENDTLIPRDFQLTFITPIGTNGIDFNKVENKISINILAGHHGGLDGAEFGGFINSIQNDATGAQFAGFANSVLGEVKGVQFAGYANYSGKVTGAQGSGFLNIAMDTVTGTQMSGFANYAHRSHKGFQGAGFMNVVRGNATGIYYVGFTNLTSGHVKGFQGSRYFNGAQKGVKGVQLAGFANYSMGKVEGAQLSGFFNFAKVLKGVQVGFINYTDSIESGAMIGFLSFARNGYHHFELEGNESTYGNVNFKTGTKKFYNILSVGGSVKENELFWGFGYGIGTAFDFGKKLGMNIDLTASHINKDQGFSSDLNMLSKLKPNVSYSFHKNFTIYGGPSLNLLLSETNGSGNAPQSEGLVGHSFYNKNIGDNKVKMFFGFQGGIRF